MAWAKGFVDFSLPFGEAKYAIGNASEDSFGEDYEFDTIEEMLQAFLSGEKI